ncbi:response regulator, partial [Acidobacteria bacterium AH-259-D05]|nr:response regulator [Acidobacteria bacterium AH-259-D05]
MMCAKQDVDLKRFTGTKVLVVDDEPQVLRLLRKFLEKRGCVFVGASNAKEAITKVQEENPRVVLLDITLPDRNGLVVMQEIQRIDPSIGIIFISGWAG